MTTQRQPPSQVLTEGLKWNKKGSGDYATYESTDGRFSIWKRRDTGNWDMKSFSKGGSATYGGTKKDTPESLMKAAEYIR
jgi:hypothetical protein